MTTGPDKYLEGESVSAADDSTRSGRWRSRPAGAGRRAQAIACAALACGIVLSATAVAGASTVPSASKSGNGFNRLQKVVEAELTARQHRLANLTTEVAAAKDLTSTDRSTLESDLTNEMAGVNALAAKVAKDTTLAELVADHKAMIVDYRVYVVMSPQVHLTIAADDESTAEQSMQDVEPQLEALIQYEQSQGKNVQGAQTAYQDLVIQVSSAENDTAGVAAAVLGTSPAAWPGNRTIFSNGHSSLIQGRTALHTAQADRKTILKDLGL